MTWKERLIGLPLAALGAVLLIATGAGMTLTRTDWGREQLRRFAVEQLNRRMNGHVEIDAFLGGDLLRQVRLAGVRIRGADGQHFASVDTLELRYRWADLLIGEIGFSSVTLVGPVVTFSISSEGVWNVEEIFRGRGESGANSGTSGDSPGGRTVVLRRLAIRSGDLSLRMPWTGDRDAAEITSWHVEEVRGRLVRVFRIERLNATLPIARIVAPDDVGRLLQIAQFTGRVGVYGEPINVEQLRADVEIRGATVGFDIWEAVLPESRLFGKGSLTLGGKVDYDLSLRGAPVNTQDFLWLESRLPEGVAQLDFHLRNLPDGVVVEAVNAEWESDEAKLSGRFAATLRGGREGVEFDRVELDIERFRTSLVTALTGWELPTSGEIAGRLELDGPLSELQLYADLDYRPEQGRGTHVTAEGAVYGVRERFGASALQLSVDTLPLDLVRAFVPGLALRGQLAGVVQLEGDLADSLAVYFEIEQRDGDLTVARLNGGGHVWAEAGAKPRVDLEALADPLSLSALSKYYPAIPFRGELEGQIGVRGRIDRFDLWAHLGGADGDSLHVLGEVELAGDVPVYAGEIRGSRVRLAHVREGFTNLDFWVELTGRGTKVEDLDTRGHIEVYSSFVSDVQVDTGYAIIRVADGRLHVDTLVLRAEFGEIRIGGGLGIVSGVVDSLSFEFKADSLGLNRWLRPGFEPLVQPALATNGATSARVAEAPRIEGQARVSGQIVGSLVAPLVRATVELEATGVIVPGGVRIDSLNVSGQLKDRVATAEFHVITEGAAAAVTGRVWARLEAERRTLGLEQLTVKLGSSTWQLAGPSTLELANSGAIVVESLTIESSNGRIELDGSIPAAGPVSFTADVDGVDLSEVAALWPDSSGIAGVLTLHAELSGRASDPLLESRFEVVDGQVLGAPFSSLRATFGYRDGDLAVDAGMWLKAQRLFRLHGSFPVDLTLPGLGVELPERAIRLTFEGDRIPLSLMAGLTDEIANPSGHAEANVRITGSPKDVSLDGRVGLVDGSVHIVGSGVTYNGLEGELTFRGDSIKLSGVAFEGSTEGRGRLSGFIHIGDLGRPVFDLNLAAEALPAYARPEASIWVSGSARLRGPYDGVTLEGRVSVVQGVVSVEEIGRRREIITFLLIGEPFAVQEGLRRGRSVFLDNLSLDTLHVNVERDTWVRDICTVRFLDSCSYEHADVLIAGDLTATGRPWRDSLRIDGTLRAQRGNYQLFNKRFEVSEGTFNFVGSPRLNPDIRIVATRLAQTQTRPIEIRVVITGTLEEPKLTLQSDAQPPIDESDLLSYLLVGRPAYAITRAGAEGGSLIGDVASGGLSSAFDYALESLLAGGIGLDYVQVSQAPVATAEIGPSGVPPAFAATQVEVGWYLAPTVFVSVGRRLFGAVRPTVRPTVRVDWQLQRNLTVRGITEPRFAREATLFETVDLEQTFGLFLFYGWSY